MSRFDRDDTYKSSPTIPEVKNYINADVDTAKHELKKEGFKSIDVIPEFKSYLNMDTDAIVTDVKFKITLDGKHLNVPSEYIVDKSGDIYSEGDGNDIAANAIERYNNPGVYASKSTKHHKKITAAEDDIEYEDIDDAVDDIDSIDDKLDDISDTVDDMQDQLDDEMFEESDPDIELDNNIAGHYIAECESCHNVFISAVIESDQEIEKISGICPVCDRDTDQYLKWVIKDVNDK